MESAVLSLEKITQIYFYTFKYLIKLAAVFYIVVVFQAPTTPKHSL